MTGVVYSVSTWLKSSPPTMATPSGLRSSEPIPLPNASGMPLSSAAMVVIRIGRNRSRARLVDGLGASLVLFALGFERKIDHHDAVLLHDADEQNDADDRRRCRGRGRTARSASSAPTPADGSVERIVIGCMKLS